MIALRRDDAARDLAVGVRDEKAVAVEVEDTDAATDARDAHHLAQRGFGIGHVREHGRREHGVEAAISERQRAAVAGLPFAALRDPGFRRILAREPDER